MKRTSFNQYIKDADFRGLFITEMGWNRFHGQAELVPIAIEDKVDGLVLDSDGRRVRAHQSLLVHTDVRRIERRFAMLRLREETDAAARTDGVHGELDQRVAAHRKQRHIRTAALGDALALGHHVGVGIERKPNCFVG